MGGEKWEGEVERGKKVEGGEGEGEGGKEAVNQERCSYAICKHCNYTQEADSLWVQRTFRRSGVFPLQLFFTSHHRVSGAGCTDLSAVI